MFTVYPLSTHLTLEGVRKGRGGQIDIHSNLSKMKNKILPTYLQLLYSIGIVLKIVNPHVCFKSVVKWIKIALTTKFHLSLKSD